MDIAPVASSQAATPRPGPADHADEPDRVKRRWPHQHPAGAGQIAGGQSYRDSDDQRQPPMARVLRRQPA